MQMQRGQRAMIAGSLLQLATLFAPAVQVPITGAIPFFRVETAGVVFSLLALASLLVALRPYGRGRWVPVGLSAAITVVTYWQIRTAPSGTFLDPLVRRAVHAGWGFVPMLCALMLGIVGAGLVRPAEKTDPAARLMR